MKKPDKNSYIPLGDALTGDTRLAKWMIDYSAALEKYIGYLESKQVIEIVKCPICYESFDPHKNIKYSRPINLK